MLHQLNATLQKTLFCWRHDSGPWLWFFPRRIFAAGLQDCKSIWSGVSCPEDAGLRLEGAPAVHLWHFACRLVSIWLVTLQASFRRTPFTADMADTEGVVRVVVPRWDTCHELTVSTWIGIWTDLLPFDMTPQNSWCIFHQKCIHHNPVEIFNAGFRHSSTTRELNVDRSFSEPSCSAVSPWVFTRCLLFAIFSAISKEGLEDFSAGVNNRIPFGRGDLLFED